MLQSESFRDPSGYVTIKDKQITRVIKKKEALKYLDLYSKSLVIQDLIKKKQFISYSILKANDDQIFLKHPFIDFISYPYEWSPSMLYDSAKLTIELAIQLLTENKGLKDASCFNVLFEGTNPIFIDFLSIEQRNNNPYWLAFAQFIRMFILPLYLNRNYKISIKSMLINHLNGLEYFECRKITRKYSFFEISLIHLPYLLSKYKTDKIYKNTEFKNLDLARFITKKVLSKAEKYLKKVKPKIKRQSNWSNYLLKLDHYTNKEFEQKSIWVKNAIQQISPKKVLDVGCNTGHFSMIAAKENARVIAVDFDEIAIDKLYNLAKIEKLDILPLVVDISKPTPSIGWKNSEYFSFLQRSFHNFDLVMMLAIIHHLLISERIPMQKIAELTSQITKKYLIIEFVEPNDPMFLKLIKGRNELYKHISLKHFINSFSKYFTFINETKQNYHPSRKLFLLKKISQ